MWSSRGRRYGVASPSSRSTRRTVVDPVKAILQLPIGCRRISTFTTPATPFGSLTAGERVQSSFAGPARFRASTEWVDHEPELEQSGHVREQALDFSRRQLPSPFIRRIDVPDEKRCASTTLPALGVAFSFR